MLLALKIDVDTYAAAHNRLNPLLETLKAAEAEATFFINMGPDRSGRCGGKAFQIGETRAQQRLNWRHAKPRGAARFYGTLLPVPLMVNRAAQAMRAIQQAGHETGLRSWDWVSWINQADTADEAWLKTEMVSAYSAFEQVFGQRAHALSLPGWHAPRAALRLEQRMDFDYASDTRGTHPYLPVVDGEPVCVPQIPTTLPTLAELTEAHASDEQLIAALLAKTAAAPHRVQVFCINAQADTGKRLPLLAKLFAAWREQGYQLSSLRQVYSQLDVTKLDWHTVERRAWLGYAEPLACQCDRFPN